MADVRGASVGGYRPEMDGPAHEKGYSRFTHFTAVVSVFVACVVASLALGGVKNAWVTTMVGVVLALIATSVGLFSEKLAWRPGAVLLALLALLMLLY